MLQFFADILPKGHPYTKAEALLDILLHAEILKEPQRNNKLQLRWSWSNSKTVARFLQNLEECNVISGNNLLLSVHGMGLGAERRKMNVKAFIEPPKPQIIKDGIYREFDHLSISNAGVEKLLSIGYTKEQIDSTLDEISNYKKNINYKDLFITAKEWLKRKHKTLQQPKLWAEFEPKPKQSKDSSSGK